MCVRVCTNIDLQQGAPSSHKAVALFIYKYMYKY